MIARQAPNSPQFGVCSQSILLLSAAETFARRRLAWCHTTWGVAQSQHATRSTPGGTAPPLCVWWVGGREAVVANCHASSGCCTPLAWGAWPPNHGGTTPHPHYLRSGQGYTNPIWPKRISIPVFSLFFLRSSLREWCRIFVSCRQFELPSVR